MWEGPVLFTAHSAWKMLHVLMELQCLSDQNVPKDYLGTENWTMLNWGEGELTEILQSSEAVPKFKNLTVCEFDESVEWLDKKLISSIMERLIFPNTKKIILIFSERDRVFFEKFKSVSSIYFKELGYGPSYEFDTFSLVDQASLGDVNEVVVLLNNGVDVNGTLGGGTTALHEAASKGCRDVALVLLSRGAKHLPNELQNTPLHEAAQNGHEDVVKLLLDNGADVNIKGNWDETALICAAKNGHENVVKLLLEYDADVNVKRSWDQTEDQTALHYAAQNGHENVVKLLLENDADVNIKGRWDQTALHNAAEYGHKDLVLTLLNHGAEYLEDGNQTPLIKAILHDHEDVVKVFLEKGVEVNANVKGPNGCTPLHYATMTGNKNLVLTLLKYGAKFLPNRIKNTPLHSAAESGYNDIVTLFLENGVDVNTRGFEGNTALHYAVEEGQKDVIITLVKKGADIHLKNDDDKTAIDLAQNQMDIIKLLIKE